MSQPCRSRLGNLARRVSPALCLVLLSAFDAPPADQVDDYIAGEMLKWHIPSLSLAVVKDGKVVKSKAYGLANLELKVPATTSTVYQLQSITKSFVACGIMLLVEDGKIALDDKITKYLSGLPAAWSEVTVRQMLTHTSGIPSFVQDQGSGAAIVAFAQKTNSTDEIISWAAARPLKFALGEGRKIQQHRLPSGGSDHREGDGQTLGTVSERAHLRAARHDQHAGIQSLRHHPQPRIGLQPFWRRAG